MDWAIAGILLVVSFSGSLLSGILGGCYGLTVVPALLILGFSPLQVVPAVLVSHMLTGLSGGVLHNQMGNVAFGSGQGHFRSAFLLSVFSLVGVGAAVSLAIALPEQALKIFIGMLIMLVGLAILLTKNKSLKFSWKKLMALGLIASFVKGLSGGGYGPLVAGGQMLTGVDAKHAVSITSLALGLTSLSAVLMYYVFLGATIDWSLAPLICIGALSAVPVAALTVKKIKAENLKSYIGFLALALGFLTLASALILGA